MANTIVYPFGTGQVPSGIGIVNDLTTGGADKALSAEQGKVLGTRTDIVKATTSSDFAISDEHGIAVLEVANGHIKTKNFDSSVASTAIVVGHTLIL